MVVHRSRLEHDDGGETGGEGWLESLYSTWRLIPEPPKPWNHMGISRNHGPYYGPPSNRALIIRTPTTRTPVYRNNHVVRGFFFCLLELCGPLACCLAAGCWLRWHSCSAGFTLGACLEPRKPTKHTVFCCCHRYWIPQRFPHAASNLDRNDVDIAVPHCPSIGGPD